MNLKHRSICLGAVLLLIGGCQSVMKSSSRDTDKQAASYIEQAQLLENEGKPVEALAQFKLAQTITPDDPLVKDGIQRLESQLGNLAEVHYQAGLRFRDKGRWDLAKKEFLKALSYRPDYDQAAAMLMQRQPAGGQDYVVHQIQSGESISRLAVKYYGDYRKYNYIVMFNDMSDATQVRVGQQIKIPVIQGVTIEDLMRVNAGASATPLPSDDQTAFTVHRIAPGDSLAKLAQQYYGDYKRYDVIARFNGITDPASIKVGQQIKIPYPGAMGASGSETAAGSKAQNTAEGKDRTPDAGEPGTPSETVASAPVEDSSPADQVAGYRETAIALFNDGKYEDAMIELQKVLSAQPDDAQAMTYLSRAYVEVGRQHLTAGRLEQAKRSFTTALDYDAHCADCSDLLAQCRGLETKRLLAEGEQDLQNNRFDQAVDRLKRAVALTPGDPAATNLLFQAYYQKALVLYEKKDYLAAQSGFDQAQAVKPDCDDCRRYMDDSRSAYLEFNYNEGIVYFGREELKPAIQAWEKVIAVDPGYKDVQQNMQKAQLLNERLERIIKSRE